jgi:hypothetical protein
VVVQTGNSVAALQVVHIFMLVVLTVVPVLPACIYFLRFQEDMAAYQRALQVPQLIFLLASLVFGCSAVRPLNSKCKFASQSFFNLAASVVVGMSDWCAACLTSMHANAPLQHSDLRLQLRQILLAARQQQQYALSMRRADVAPHNAHAGVTLKDLKDLGSTSPPAQDQQSTSLLGVGHIG